VSLKKYSEEEKLYTEVVIAGFGGQGVIFSGKLLAYAGLKEGREVVYYPSYGAEMRGGAANCTVIVSDSMVPSPIISHPQSGILMSYPALKRFLPRIREGGYVVVNTSLTGEDIKREGIEVVKVPANSIAQNLGNSRTANMVALGVWACISRVVSLESLILSLKEVLSPDKFSLLELNENCLRQGWEFASQSN